MSPAFAAIALAVTAGAVVAVAARESRAALLGLAVALTLGPFLADPLPGAASLGARVVTAVLVVYLLRAVGAAQDGPGAGSRIGWPAESMLAAGAAIAGVAISVSLAGLDPVGGPASASDSPLDQVTPAALALGAGSAALVVAAAPALLGRRPIRVVIGLLLAIQGAVLVRTGLAGPPGELELLGIGGLVLSVGAAGALLSWIERHGSGATRSDDPGGEPRRGHDRPGPASPLARRPAP